MAPYDPPVAHYSQLDVSQYTDEQILSVIGKGGKGFYKLPANSDSITYGGTRNARLWRCGDPSGL